jgi:predicted metal-dependent phosphoesterase TrpH
VTRNGARRAVLSSWLVVLLVVLAGSLSGGAAATDPVLLRSRESGLATLSLRAFDASSRTPLAVRARLVPRSLLGEAEVHVAVSGRLDLTPRAGDYQLVVTHGPEWSIHELSLSLAPGSARRVVALLEREVAAQRWTAVDPHVHSDHSPDADLSLAERAASLKAEDVHFAVLTDHNTVTRSALEHLAALDIGSLPGVEVTTWQPEFGHFNVFPALRAPKYRHTHEAELLRELRRDPQAFVQINHPRLEQHIGYFELRARPQARRHHAPDKPKPLPFDGIEVWNGYDLTRPARRDAMFQEWLSLLAQGQRIVATGGSDSHHLRLPYAGYPRTYVDVPRVAARDEKRVLSALRAGRSFISSGPILELSASGHVPGDTLRVPPGQTHVAVEVRVAGPRWMDLAEVELWLDQRCVARAKLPEAGARVLPIQFSLPVRRQHALVAVVRGTRGMRALLGRDSAEPFAFTNPIWLRRSK